MAISSEKTEEERWENETNAKTKPAKIKNQKEKGNCTRVHLPAAQSSVFLI